jgi:hypothetical protein
MIFDSFGLLNSTVKAPNLQISNIIYGMMVPYRSKFHAADEKPKNLDFEHYSVPLDHGHDPATVLNHQYIARYGTLSMRNVILSKILLLFRIFFTRNMFQHTLKKLCRRFYVIGT